MVLSQERVWAFLASRVPGMCRRRSDRRPAGRLSNSLSGRGWRYPNLAGKRPLQQGGAGIEDGTGVPRPVVTMFAAFCRSPSEGVRVAFIVEDGAPIEFIQFL
jgi:hypothetical protein